MADNRQYLSGAESIGPADSSFGLGDLLGGMSRMNLGGFGLQPGPTTDRINNFGRNVWQSGLVPESGSPFGPLFNQPQPPPQAAPPPSPTLPRALANPGKEAAGGAQTLPVQNPYWLAEADAFLKPRQERRDQLTAQGFQGFGAAGGLPDQFIKADLSKTRGRGFGQTWNPVGGGTVSEGGATTPENAMLGRLNQDTQIALAQQGLEKAQLSPSAFLKPDPYRQKLQAAMVAVAMAKKLGQNLTLAEAMNAVGNHGFDQNALPFSLDSTQP